MQNININTAPYYNTDQIADTISSTDMFDCYLEPVPGTGFVTRRRPGLINFSNLNTNYPLQGLYYWESAQRVIGVSNGQIFEVKQDSTIVSYGGATLDKTANCTFAEAQTLDGKPWLYIANGKLAYLTQIDIANITDFTWADNILTMVTDKAHDLRPGMQITITSPIDTAFAGTFTVKTANVNIATFTLVGDPGEYTVGASYALTLGTNIAYYPQDIDTPNATHVAYINGKFIANDVGTNRWKATDVNPATNLPELDYWSSFLNPNVCDAKGDLLVGLFAAWQEVLAWGTDGLQVFQDNGTQGFVNIPGASAEYGMEAPYSYAKADNTVFVLATVDRKRCVIKITGRTPQVISNPIGRILADMDVVSDAVADIINPGGMSMYVITFPSENQTWAYDYVNDTWSRWGKYNGDADDRSIYMGTHSCYAKSWNKHLIGCNTDSRVFEVSRDAFDDAGTPCIPFRRTGWLNFGTPERKRFSSFYITGKPGRWGEAKLMMRWRDNGKNFWSRWIQLSFKDKMVEPMNRFGTFRTRQFEFRIPSDEDTILVSAGMEAVGLAG